MAPIDVRDSASSMGGFRRSSSAVVCASEGGVIDDDNKDVCVRFSDLGAEGLEG